MLTRVPTAGRGAVLALVAASAAALSACGSGGSTSTPGDSAETRAARPTASPVGFEITSHSAGDVVRVHETILRGTAEKGATVYLGGEPITVNQAGNWRKTVPLELGDNSFELSANKSGRESVEEVIDLTRRRNAAELAAYRERLRIEREQREAAEAARRAAEEAVLPRHAREVHRPDLPDPAGRPLRRNDAAVGDRRGVRLLGRQRLGQL
jgi:hypothetical protein